MSTAGNNVKITGVQTSDTSHFAIRLDLFNEFCTDNESFGKHLELLKFGTWSGNEGAGNCVEWLEQRVKNVADFNLIVTGGSVKVTAEKR